MPTLEPFQMYWNLLDSTQRITLLKDTETKWVNFMDMGYFNSLPGKHRFNAYNMIILMSFDIIKIHSYVFPDAYDSDYAARAYVEPAFKSHLPKMPYIIGFLDKMKDSLDENADDDLLEFDSFQLDLTRNVMHYFFEYGKTYFPKYMSRTPSPREILDAFKDIGAKKLYDSIKVL